jgi:hydroxyacylglutathione hydrolase
VTISTESNTAMPLEIVTVPCLQDNYAYLVHNRGTGQTALIDAPEAAPIQQALALRGWTLSDILITHHHGDHIDGVAALRDGARVIGASADAHRLPPLDLAVEPGQTFQSCDRRVEVMGVPGHTVGHVAYYIPTSNAVFTADSLMALGCGRLFEGTAAQMWRSLSDLATLPPDTLICSGHEYTAANARFAVTIEPDNEALQARLHAISSARKAGLPTVPTHLSLERQTNPFLRAGLASVKAAIGMPDASDVEAFAEIRRRKDHF